MTVAEIITALQSHDPNAICVVMPYADPVLVDEITTIRATTLVATEASNGRRIFWREYDAVRGTTVAAVALFDGV